MIGRASKYGAVYGSYGAHPKAAIKGIQSNQIHSGLGAWYDYLNPYKAAQATVDYFKEDEGPPSYDTVTAADTSKIVANTKVKDGAYSWIVYSNGDLKIFNVPAGKEALIGTRYKIGDTNYAKTLAILRSRSKEVDKVLAKGGLDGAKLAQGATASGAATAPKKGGTGDDTTRTGGTGGGGLQLGASGIAGIAMGVVGLVLVLGLVFKRKRKRKGKK